MGIFWEVVSALIVIAGLGIMVASVARFIHGLVVSNDLDKRLRKHFRPRALSELVVNSRKFSVRVRADLLPALEKLLAEQTQICHFTGVVQGMCETPDLTGIQKSGLEPAPPQYDELNIGEETTVRCLRNGLWLVRHKGVPHAVCCASGFNYAAGEARHQLTVQVASPPDEHAQTFGRQLLQKLEQVSQQLPSYRGKILSLELVSDWQGTGGEITVHKLHPVSADQLVLPDATVELLERNVIGFVRQRDRLGARGMSRKKGLLFYGPPGTGKTHTLHYLARALPDHTTLIITAEQISLLGEYMNLARLLQPALVVIEDADLISRQRTDMNSSCEEMMLNKLLNEMDGLRASADILFILTTNRPEALEQALAARPGRIDQAVEFPLPDFEGRRRLIRLYSGGLEMSEELAEQTALLTEGVSASFIKELMRRSAQVQLERDGDGPLGRTDVEQALDEMLFSGGTLNRKLLGAISVRRDGSWDTVGDGYPVGAGRH